MGNLFQELKRRNVFKVGAVYVVVAWLLIQIVTAILPTFNAPEWVSQTIIFLLALGLPITLIIVWAFELTPQGIRKTEKAGTGESVTTGITDYALGALLLIVLGFMTVQQFDLFDAEEGMEPTASTDRVAETPALIEEPPSPTIELSTPIDNMSIAVLVLRNESPDPDNEYFAAGFHEEILNQLSKISALQLKSRTTVLRYADSDLSVAEIALELNVATIMEGSVFFADNRVRITLQLIDAMDDVHLWSETYTRELNDIFAIQSDVAIQVADAMQATLSPVELASIERPATESTEAYSLLLEARYQAQVYGNSETVDANILRMEDAIKLDPLFAQGIAELGWFKFNKGLLASFQDEAKNALYDEALDYANQAIDIDPTVERAYSVLARVNFNLRQFDEWERYSLLSVELPDLDGSAAANYSYVLGVRGRHEEARKWRDVAISKDPSSAFRRGNAVFIRIDAGDYETALELAEYIPATGGDEYIYHSSLAYALNRLGRQAESIVHLNELSRERMLTGRSPAGDYHAYLLCQQGEQDNIMADLEQSDSIRKDMKMTYCAAGAGDLDGMFASYQRAMNVGAIILYNDLITDEIKADSRWPALLDYMDLRDPD